MIGAQAIPLYEAEATVRQKAALKVGSKQAPLPPPGGHGESGTAAKFAAKAIGASERSTERAVKVLADKLLVSLPVP